jgi:hypothetical protein
LKWNAAFLLTDVNISITTSCCEKKNNILRTFSTYVSYCTIFPAVQLVKVILLYTHGYWREVLMKTFIFSFFHRKSIMQQQNQVIEEIK